MHREQIKELALANGFKLKTQPDGSEDLNPYVYDFAAALMAPLQAELKRQQDENSRLLFSNRYSADMYRQIDDERKRLQAEVEQLQAQLNAAKRGMDSAAAAGRLMLEKGRKLAAENSPEAIESEREANAVLTAENEQLQAEVERLRALWKTETERATTAEGELLKCRVRMISIKQERDAEVIEQWIGQARYMEGLNVNDIIESAEDYANQLRQQAKEVQS
jgi:hypothetical protein